jgi:hypothetical protein
MIIKEKSCRLFINTLILGCIVIVLYSEPTEPTDFREFVPFNTESFIDYLDYTGDTGPENYFF